LLRNVLASVYVNAYAVVHAYAVVSVYASVIVTVTGEPNE
jgi:hypothetical protein